MWQPINIRFKNLFSHSYTEFDFIKGEIILLLGVIEDLIDIDGADSNGAGKSTVIEAVTLAIIGDVYRGVTKQDFIKNGEKSCAVEMYLRNDSTSSSITDLKIERTFFNSSSSSKLRIYTSSNDTEDIEEKTDLPTSNDGNKFILDTLGISKEDFLNFYVIGQGNTKSFFLAGDAKQKEIVGRFSNFENIDELNGKIINRIKKLEIDLALLEKDIERADNFIQTNEQTIKDFERNRKEEKTAQINDLKETIKDLEAEQVNCLNKIDANKLVIKTLFTQNTVLKSKIDAIPNLLEKIKEIDDDIKNHRILDKELNQKSSSLNNQLGKVVVCPKCNNSFIPNSDMPLASVKQQIKIVDKGLKDLNALLTKLDNDRDQVNHNLLQAKSDKWTFDNNKKKIEDSNESIKEAETNIWKNEKSIGDYKEKIVNANKLSKNDQEFLSELKSKLNKQVEDRADKAVILRDLRKEMEEMRFFNFHFSRAGFKTYLANKSIKSIQDICNYYLKRFKTDLQVDISGYKILKDGSVRDKIDISLLKNGVKGVFNKYSGGQKSRVDLCGILTINILINNTVEPGKGLDLLMIDEIGDLDNTGKHEIVKILARSGITCVLVLHEVKEIQHKNKVYVGYKNRESYII